MTFDIRILMPNLIPSPCGPALCNPTYAYTLIFLKLMTPKRLNHPKTRNPKPSELLIPPAIIEPVTNP